MIKSIIQYSPYRTLRFFLFAAAILSSAVLHSQETEDSQEKLYEVDTIVFATTTNNDANAKTIEHWADKVQFPAFINSLEILPHAKYLALQEQSERDKYLAKPAIASPDDLSKYVNVLEKSEKYRVLFRQTWHQPMKLEKESIAIYLSDTDEKDLYQHVDPQLAKLLQQEQQALKPSVISDEQQFLDDLLVEPEEKRLNQLMQTQQDIATQQKTLATIEQAKNALTEDRKILLSEGPPEHKIFGLIKIFKARFPHVSLDLFYKDKYLEDKQEVNPEELTGTLEVKSEALNSAASKETAAVTPIVGVAKTEDGDTNLPPVINAEEVEHAESLELETGILIPQKPPRSAYHLHISSRIRLNEIYYFDHPKFGAILRIRAYEPPIEDVEDDSSS